MSRRWSAFWYAVGEAVWRFAVWQADRERARTVEVEQ